MGDHTLLDRVIDLRTRAFGDKEVPDRLSAEPIDDASGTEFVTLVRFKPWGARALVAISAFWLALAIAWLPSLAISFSFAFALAIAPSQSVIGVVAFAVLFLGGIAAAVVHDHWEIPASGAIAGFLVGTIVGLPLGGLSEDPGTAVGWSLFFGTISGMAVTSLSLNFVSIAEHRRARRRFLSNSVEAEGTILRRVYDVGTSEEGDVWHRCYVAVKFQAELGTIRLLTEVAEKIFNSAIKDPSIHVRYVPSDPKVALLSGEY